MHLTGLFLGSRGAMHTKEPFSKSAPLTPHAAAAEGLWEGTGLWVGILGDALKVWAREPRIHATHAIEVFLPWGHSLTA